MPKTRIAILGGGVGALSAAYQLSRTPELREQYDITIYQMGWRLGGKGATGRDDQGRIHEHGLHVWFGYYNNAFRMMKDVYADWHPDPDNALQTWRDALKPQDFTPVGMGRPDGPPIYWPLTWSRLGGQVGEDNVLPTPFEAVVSLVSLIVNVVRNWDQFTSLVVDGKFVDGDGRDTAMHDAVPQGLLRRYAQAVKTWAADKADDVAHAMALVEGAALHGAGEIADLTERWVRTIAGETVPTEERHAHLDAVADMLDRLEGSVAARPGVDVLQDWMTFAVPYAKGVIRDFIIAGRSADSLDDIEFTDWLISHGGNAERLRACASLRTIYDTFMQYRGGDWHKPDYGAGIAAQLCLRVLVTCKEAVMWNMQAGMGEVIIAPIYQLIQSRGVKVRFFRRTRHLELDETRTAVTRIHLDRQVDLKDGVADYDPLITLPVENGTKKLLCWPAEPKWGAIRNGEAIRDRCRANGSSLESHWCPVEPAGAEVLERGRDFDLAILAISVGAFKKMNDEPTLADELTAASPAFAAMTGNFGLVPTQALQLWCEPDLAGLGWEPDRPSAVTGPEPMSVWADMSQTLPFEPWPRHRSRPGSVHYFCGVWATDLISRPSTDLGVPKAALADVTAQCLEWTNAYARHFWPRAATPDGTFNYKVLYDAHGGRGVERFINQFIRANVDPTECLPGSGAGTNKYRLKAGESGFTNLFLAGCWIRSGLNTSSVETATMAGMQAARAISGSPVEVSGEDFLQGRHR